PSQVQHSEQQIPPHVIVCIKKRVHFSTETISSAVLLPHRERVLKGEICPDSQAPRIAVFRTATADDALFAGFTCQVSSAVLRLDKRLVRRERREAWIGHENSYHLQHARTLKDELQETNLASAPFELTESHHVDARDDVLNGTRLLPELDGEGLTSGFITFFTLHKIRLISQRLGKHLRKVGCLHGE
uniref:Uncharacterized protein n=1 Tax=Triticum urartu TaxID=4572 RepID=A0A8R7PCV7_TRIUA